jgi:hypothetical protein
MEALDTEKQQLISRTNAYVNWDLVFKNISKFWN